MAAVVIDVNVPIVANFGHEQANLECIQACTQALTAARNQLVLVDDAQRILSAYRKYLSHSGQPGLGDAFFKWLWQNQANKEHCVQITVTPVGNSGTNFAEYPTDPELAIFDPNDRIFVAVAKASRLDAEILNASDTDWWQARKAFVRNGVRLRFLCEDLMRTTNDHVVP